MPGGDWRTLQEIKSICWCNTGCFMQHHHVHILMGSQAHWWAFSIVIVSCSPCSGGNPIIMQDCRLQPLLSFNQPTWLEVTFGRLIKRTMCIENFLISFSSTPTYALINLLLWWIDNSRVCACVCVYECVCVTRVCLCIWKTLSYPLFAFLSNNKGQRAKQFR